MDLITRCALDIIAKASREKPADATLRATLRNSKLPRADSSRVAALVFAFFRWRGCLDMSVPPERQLREAEVLDDRFRFRPDTFSFDDLKRAFPRWFAEETELSHELLAVMQSAPPLWLRAKRGTGKQLAIALGDCHHGEGPMVDALRYEGDQDLFRSREFHEGAFEIQDIASQRVGLLCDPHPGETWWDACAGEGGKLLHLSDLMANKGLIWASDRAAWRLKQLKQRAARAKAFNYRAAEWDGGAKLPTRTKFDGVLIDAPCSGVGTWRRNPHARWTTTPEDVRQLGEVQKQLLLHAAAAVKPGGKLIYAVCTLTRTETDAVAAHGSQQLPRFEPLPLPSAPGMPPEASSRKWIWPQDCDGNGMFVSAWRCLL